MQNVIVIRCAFLIAANKQMGKVCIKRKTFPRINHEMFLSFRSSWSLQTFAQIYSADTADIVSGAFAM